MKNLFVISLTLILTACAGQGTKTSSPLTATEDLLRDADSNEGNGAYIQQLYASRTWVPFSQLTRDPIELGKNAKIPVQHEGVKLLGPSKEDALRSLALKIWMIENAEHTVDVVYYIFTPDLVGQAMLGAMCNAVKRGVDVRLMVDAIGSFDPFRTPLRALETCASDAGYMRTLDGKLTTTKARVQVVVIGAITSSIAWVNRRSHDKLLVKDGAFPSKALVMTGGRNVSLDYYGINADGTEDPTAYRDVEVLLKPWADNSFAEKTVGDVSSTYYTLLFLHRNNKPVIAVYHGDPAEYDPYENDRRSAAQSLEELKGFPQIASLMRDMPDYLGGGFHDSEVLLAHELGNLTNRNVVTRTQENKEDNPNSIMALLSRLGDKLADDEGLRVVSPYMFLSRYYDEDGNVVEDGAKDIHQWLADHPRNKIELVTNSVLTSDNFMAQAIIDMDVAPRLLLTPEQEKAWLSGLEKGEYNLELVESEEWKNAINHPQIFIHQSGKLDSAYLGNGDAQYGKLHAKFMVGDDISFVGTANFDYRSRLFNNEMGFFIKNEQVQVELNAMFDDLRDAGYRWGTPEWLQMRKEVIEAGTIKGWSTKQQRGIFKFMRATGLDWLI